MKVEIHHYLPGRIRLHYNKNKYTSKQAILATTLIAVQDGILDIDVNTHIGSFLVCFEESVISKQELINLFKALTGKYLNDKKLLAEVQDIPESESIFGVIAQTLAIHYFKKWFLPIPLRNCILFVKQFIQVLQKTFSIRIYSMRLRS